MEDMLIGEDWMACQTVEEVLEHPLAPRNKGNVLLGPTLFHCILAEGLFGRYGRNNEGRV